jgi:hypothetical protein
MRSVARRLKQLLGRFPRAKACSTVARPERSVLEAELLEDRTLLNAAYDLIGLTALRRDPSFAGLDGSGVTVAVIDTGLDAAQPLIAPGFVTGWDFLTNSPSTTDPLGHGTQVAGVIGARNPEVGVAPGVNLIGLKVGGVDGSPDINLRALESALEWVDAHHLQFNIQVVNLSVGSGFYTAGSSFQSDPLYADVKRLEADGVTVVAAAGNYYRLGGEVRNSAAPGVFSTLDVGAVWQDGVNSNVQWGTGEIDFTTGADRVVSFSQRPDTPNVLFAPGAILQTTLPGGGTGANAGTSIAAPVVSGVAAIVQEAAYHFGGRYLAPDEMRQVLQSTADTVFDGDDENFNVRPTNASYPRVNVYSAVKLIRQMFDPPSSTGTGEDDNGTLGGAYLGPNLSGADSFSLNGNLGSDGDGELIGPSDVDLVKFQVLTPGTVTAETFARNFNTVDTYLRLFDSNGVELTANNDKSATDVFSRLQFDLQPGVYYVGVSGFPNTNYDPHHPGSGVPGATGDYRLSLSLATRDPDGVISGANQLNLIQQPVVLGASIGMDGSQFVGPSDVDLYEVRAPDDGTLTIDLGGSYGSSTLNGSLEAWLVQASGALTPLFTPQTGNPIHQTVTVLHGQTVLIGVADASNTAYDPRDLSGPPSQTLAGSGGRYDLRLGFTNGDADGTLATAVDLPGPVANSPGRLGRNADGTPVGPRDVNFYHLRWSTGGVLELRVASFGAPSITDPVRTLLTVWDAAGHKLASSSGDPGPDPLLRYVIQANTDYYVSVSSSGNDSFSPTVVDSGTAGPVGSYLFTASLLPADLAGSFGDNSVQSGAPGRVYAGTAVTGSIGYDGSLAVGPADVDLYRFQPSAEGMVTVRVAPSGPNGVNAVLRVFDASGVELAFSDASSGGSVRLLQFHALAGQTYYIGVNGASPGARAYNPLTGAGAVAGSTGPYTLSLSQTSDRAAFAAGLASDLFGRPADAAAMAAQDQALTAAQAPAMAAMATNFVLSAEARGNLVRANYQTLLGRAPSADEVSAWVAQFQQGLSPEALVRFLVASTEYYLHSGGSNANWLSQVYQDLLGRAPEPGTAQLVLNLLNAHAITRDQIAQNILASPEYQCRVVRTLYQRYLGRAASDAEVSNGQQFLAQPPAAGQPARSDQLLALVLASAEFAHRAGDTAALWVSGLYTRFLGHAGDPAGLGQATATVLNAAAPARVSAALGQLQSDEARGLFVRGLFRQLLGRSGSAVEVNGIVSLMRGGVTAGQVFAAFLASGEYGQASGGTDAGWVSRAYVDVLGRPVDAASLTTLVNALATGTMTRAQIATALLTSPEYYQHFIANAYQTYLGRAVSAAELTNWLAAFQNGLTTDQALANVLGSSEYFARIHPVS